MKRKAVIVAGGEATEPAPKVIVIPKPELEEVVPPEPQPEPEPVPEPEEVVAPEPQPKEIAGSITEIRKIDASQSLSMQELEKLIHEHLKQIEDCFRQILQKGSVKTQAILKVTIDSAGHVKAVEFISENLKNSDLKTCVEKQVRQWQFPIPTDGKDASVEYSLVFEI